MNREEVKAESYITIVCKDTFKKNDESKHSWLSILIRNKEVNSRKNKMTGLGTGRGNVGAHDWRLFYLNLLVLFLPASQVAQW